VIGALIHLVIPVLAVLAVGIGFTFAQTMAVSTGSPPQAPTSTIGNLPACTATTQGQIYLVTDALLPTLLATVAAGGAVKAAVMCNGSNYVVI